MNTSLPIEIGSMDGVSIKELSQKKFSKSIRNLNQYMQSNERLFVTMKGDSNTNIIDQGAKKTYHFPCTTDLFTHLENCRLEGSIVHFSEKQVDPSGLMIDFDIITSDSKITILPIISHLTKLIFNLLNQDVDLNNTKNYIFYTTRPIVDKKENNTYKYGFHILIPGIKLNTIYKKWFLQNLKNNTILSNLFKDINVLNFEECVDQNSASVYVLFLGSCKASNTAIPYVLSYVYEISIEDNMMCIQSIPLDNIKNFNLVAELSLNSEAYYDDKQCLVNKKQYNYKPEVLIKLKEWEDKRESTTILSNDDSINNSLSTLTMHNPEAEYLYNLLDILPEEYYTDRNKWRNVIYALANTSDQYKPLAIWFSQKCEEKWLNNGLAELEYLWLSNKSDNPITISSIAYWAQISNPEKYKSVMKSSYFTLLTTYVYMCDGNLQHYMIAKVLYAMLHNKFCVDYDNKTCYWFEFVVAGEPMIPGEVWKWRKEIEPSNLQIYISEKLINVFEMIDDYIIRQKQSAEDETKCKYYNKLELKLKQSKQNLFQNAFKKSVIEQASLLFRKRGFLNNLDTIPHLFGVGNGVLELGSKCKLINYYHEYPVSKYTSVNWIPFDPTNSWTILVLNAISDIIIESDVRDWILFHAAQGLSRDTKEGLLLFFEGGGQNGKTSLLRWIQKSLGPYAEKFNIQLLACEREEADKPNSAIMRFKHMNWAYAEESNREQSLNVARMKELVNAGEISGRDLNSKQETFTIKCNFVIASQYSFKIDTTDHGTWRRLRHYRSKTKFCSNPDPNNPYEKKDNQDFNSKYINDPNFLSSMLSILTHYYERLHNEYNGQLKNVPCPTLEIETEEFRISQDSIHRWICQRVVISPEAEIEYDIGSITLHYIEWYKLFYINSKVVITPDSFLKDLKLSVLNKYLESGPNRVILKGCRILGPDNTLRDNEEYISIKESYKEKQSVQYHKSEWWLPNADKLN